eukprot:jgi/Picsp_1/1012/NSC_04496-R1_mate efflux family protein chloroplastic-like
MVVLSPPIWGLYATSTLQINVYLKCRIIGNVSRWERKAGVRPLAAGQNESVPVKRDDTSIDLDILRIAGPTIATLASDPLAALVSTAFVGHLGSCQLAGVGVSLSVYNSFTKLFNMPLLAIITTTIAAALGDRTREKIDGVESSSIVGEAVVSAIVLSLIVGAAQSIMLLLFGKSSLVLYGLTHDSEIYSHALAYLSVRSLGNAATVLFVSLLGIFRGLGDAMATLVATVFSTLLNIGMEYLFLFQFGWGVTGAAGAVVLSQLIACTILIKILASRVSLRNIKKIDMETCSRVLSSTVSTGLVARTDVNITAAHQIAFQVWLASSLLADSLAVAAQALIARELGGKKNANDARISKIAARSCSLGLSLGATLSIALLILMLVSPMSIFTRDPAVINILCIIFPAIIISQPVNAFAFVLDGVLYGFGEFTYTAKAMAFSALPAICTMYIGFMLCSSLSLDSICILKSVWAGLFVLMVMRSITMLIRLKNLKKI